MKGRKETIQQTKEHCGGRTDKEGQQERNM
jgi:hypothetical protein